MSRDHELLEQLPALFEKYLDDLRAQLATSTETIRDTGARPIRVRSSNRGTNTPATSPGALAGFSLTETTGANPAKVYLRDGVDSAGGILAVINLAPGESDRDWFGNGGGIGFGRGLYVDVTLGAIDGTVYLRSVA